MQNKKLYVIELLVGIFIISGILGLLFFALKVSPVNYKSENSYIIKANFDNIGNLKQGASVKSAGVSVGSVNKIIFNNQTFQAQVMIDVYNKYKFPIDSQLKIATNGLLGDQYLSMEAGAETSFLKNNDILENTQSALVLEDLIGKFLYSKAQEAPK